MGEKKTIKCSYALLVIILFATVCFLTDYIIVDRKLREDKTIIYGDVTDKVDSVVDDSNVAGSVDTDNNTVASADSRFSAYAANLKSQRQTFFNENSGFKSSYEGNNIINVKFYEVELTKVGNLSVSFVAEGKERDTRTVASGVLDYSVLNYGNGGFRGLYIIFEDGTTGFAGIEHSYVNGEEITVKKNDFKNIVSIVQGSYSDGMSSALGAVYIDIDGNLYK